LVRASFTGRTAAGAAFVAFVFFAGDFLAAGFFFALVAMVFVLQFMKYVVVKT
jgi:hypothetical protein